MAQPTRVRINEGRVATLRDTEREARTSVLADLDQLTRRTEDGEQTKTSSRTDVRGARARIENAQQTSEEVRRDLRDLTLGLETRLQELGESVKTSSEYAGVGERVMHGLGVMGFKSMLDRAERRRLVRLEAMPIKESLRLIERLVDDTITELGVVEVQFQDDVQNAEDGYIVVIQKVLDKLNRTQPELTAVKASREAAEVELTTIERNLESGVVEDDRPRLEQEHEALQLRVNELRLQESNLLTAVQKAQEAIPILKQQRQAKEKEIEAIHMMRRGLFEKFENLKVVFARAMTEVIAQAKTARFQDVDPAFNFATDQVVKNTVRTAGALMETAIERANRAAIDPARALEYAQEFREYLEAMERGIVALEEQASRGGVYAQSKEKEKQN